jgi:ABC-2 type transport system permease protein
LTPTEVRPRVGFSLRGMLTVAVHEFRLRIRAGRWRWLLGLWFFTLFALTALLRSALVTSGQANPGTDMFGGLMLFMLALALLVVPALTAQSVNGDRIRGVLATLQTTLLTPAEIAVGKLVAAWGTAVVFLLLAVPLALWCVAEGGSGARVAVSLLIAAILLGVMCAVAQCLSALFARTTTSAVMSYLVVFALAIGTVIAFGLALVLTQTTETRTSGDVSYEVTETHPERVWWLLAPNPFVIVADAAPRPTTQATGPDDGTFRLDPLGAIAEVARSMRAPQQLTIDEEGNIVGATAPVWPYGLAANVVFGAAALVVTARRLRTPYGQLPKSVRVA